MITVIIRFQPVFLRRPKSSYGGLSPMISNVFLFLFINAQNYQPKDMHSGGTQCNSQSAARKILYRLCPAARAMVLHQPLHLLVVDAFELDLAVKMVSISSQKIATVKP
ncbi:hypothetical protein VTN00DRAFT_404 [Thermoascus crustaceus]|uniref:uncharacterized protein n=1 Tax=Thermoascus crustaceus TaxID=5088 RepID=UPI0037422CBF